MRENPLAQAYRPIRRLVPPDAPLPGLLAACGEETVLLVDADLVPPALWRPDDPAHVWSPRDVARTDAGQSAVLTWCSTTLERYLARRGPEPVEGGEAVTLLVSLLRGHREAAVDDAVTGRWWLTDAGCPTFVPGDGARLTAATLAGVEAVVEGTGDRVLARIVAPLSSLLEPPMRGRELEAVERDLFEAYAPRPLRAATMDRSSPAVLVDRVAAPVGAPAVERTRSRRRPRPLLHGWLAAARVLTRADRSDGAPDTTRAATGRRAGRRTLALVAGGAAAIVLVIGVVWPDGSASVDDGVLPPRLASAGASPDAAAGSAPVAPPSDGRSSDDPVVAARWLISAAAGCGECAEIARSADAASAAARLSDPALVEDYGGVAVVRGAGPDGERFIVLERQDGAWWIREVSARPAAG